MKPKDNSNISEPLAQNSSPQPRVENTYEDEEIFNDEDEKVFELKETLNSQGKQNTPMRNVKLSSPKGNESSIISPENLLNNGEPLSKNLETFSKIRGKSKPEIWSSSPQEIREVNFKTDPTESSF